MTLAPLALLSVTAVLLAIPVTPALFELQKRRDATALPTSRHDGRISNFADALRSRLQPVLAELESCVRNRTLSRARIEQSPVLVVGIPSFDFHPEAIRGCEVIICDVTLIPRSSVVDADVYSLTTLEVADSAVVRAALAESDIRVGKNSTVLRWLHSGENACLQQGSMVYGRLSAVESIHLEAGSGFQHMYAPLILTGENDNSGRCRSSETFSAIQKNRAAGDSAGIAVGGPRPRIRVKGDFVLPAGETLAANVIASGELHFGRDSVFWGSAKGYGNAVVEEGAAVHGGIICGKKLRLNKRSTAVGPLVAEEGVLISSGCIVGNPESLTTISSPVVTIAAGCRIHGTVWARLRGTIEA